MNQTNTRFNPLKLLEETFYYNEATLLLMKLLKDEETFGYDIVISFKNNIFDYAIKYKHIPEFKTYLDRFKNNPDNDDWQIILHSLLTDIAENYPELKDEVTKFKNYCFSTYIVDLPNPYDLSDWVQVEYFTFKSDALRYVQEQFGADENGKINLISKVSNTQKHDFSNYYRRNICFD